MTRRQRMIRNFTKRHPGVADIRGTVDALIALRAMGVRGILFAGLWEYRNRACLRGTPKTDGDEQ